MYYIVIKSIFYKLNYQTDVTFNWLLGKKKTLFLTLYNYLTVYYLTLVINWTFFLFLININKINSIVNYEVKLITRYKI